MVDPDDRIEVSTVTKYYNHQLKDIDENTKLDDMLDNFKVFTDNSQTNRHSNRTYRLNMFLRI